MRWMMGRMLHLHLGVRLEAPKEALPGQRLLIRSVVQKSPRMPPNGGGLEPTSSY